MTGRAGPAFGLTRALYVFSGRAGPAPIDQVRHFLEPVTSKTERFDQYRTVTVQCWPAERASAFGSDLAAMPKLKEFEKQLPNGFIFCFAGEQKEQVSGFGDLTMVLVILFSRLICSSSRSSSTAFSSLIVFAAIPDGW